jgi:uncharacterized protein YbbC (DUF1343 family)
MNRVLAALPLLAALGCATATPPAAPAPAARVGVEALADSAPAVLRGKRVGLITNHTGLTADGRSTIDVLAGHPDVTLVALFGPEHGIRGAAEAGEKVASGVDEKTGLPVHSLYGETHKPTPAMMQGIDALVFDIQDVGARPYTYVYTMARGMQAAAEHGVPFVVLDRANPINGTVVEGGILQPGFTSGVGLYAIPERHGMTAGELAQLFNGEFGIGADLTVVPVVGWQRAQWQDEAGLEWVNPSPNLRSLTAATHYPGSVFFEGTNLSEGRGTDAPFEQLGAPWLDAAAVVEAVNALALPGVRFEAIQLTVSEGGNKFPGQTIPGIRYVLTDRTVYRPVEATVRLLEAIQRRHPEEFKTTAFLDKLSGSGELRAALAAGSVDALLTKWNAEAVSFEQARAKYLLY